MKRILIGAIVGALFGFALGIFIYPFWFLNEAATEQLVQNRARVEIAKGEFIHANPSDPVHYGQGHVTLYNEGDGRKAVHLADDFQVGPGPAFHVYLVDHAKVRSKKDFKDASKVALGKIRAFKGSQVFPVPASADMSTFKSVVVWCEEFGVLISPATLNSSKGS
jgi:hypothetical protein